MSERRKRTPPRELAAPTVEEQPPAVSQVETPELVPAARTTTPVLDAAAAAPPAAFVDMGRDDKLDTVAQLMKGETATLQQNGVSPHMEAKLGASMLNESARNQRRKNVGEDFRHTGSRLHRTLDGVDLAAVSADPARLAKLTKGMKGDTRWLFDKVAAGELDLSAFGGKDEAKKAALGEQLTQLGVDRRVEQYTEMTALAAKREDGTLGKDEKKTLAALERQKGLGMGRASLGSLEGMSPERFRGIYDEGNQRFEPVQYTSLRDSYRRNKESHDTQRLAHVARPGKVAAPDPNVVAKAGIGKFSMDPTAQASLGTNMDLVADMATSWGGGQIMGAYAQAGMMSAKRADGTTESVGLDALKASATRLTPTGEDVFQQLGFMNMKGLDLGSKSMSNGAFTTQYNGSKPGSELYEDYKGKLDQNIPAYRAARKELD